MESKPRAGEEEPVAQRFGEWVREQRLAQHLSQAQCARWAGMSLQTWNRLEKHIQRVFPATCAKIARGLDLPEEEVLAAAGYAVAAEPQEPDIRLGVRLGRVLRDLSGTQREQIEALLEQDARQYVALVTSWLPPTPGSDAAPETSEDADP